MTMAFIDDQFHIQQARLRKGKRAAVRGQKAVAPIFTDPAPGEASWYDIPAIARKKLHNMDLDNRLRAEAYTQKVQARIEGKAA